MVGLMKRKQGSRKNVPWNIYCTRSTCIWSWSWTLRLLCIIFIYYWWCRSRFT